MLFPQFILWPERDERETKGSVYPYKISEFDELKLIECGIVFDRYYNEG